MLLGRAFAAAARPPNWAEADRTLLPVRKLALTVSFRRNRVRTEADSIKKSGANLKNRLAIIWGLLTLLLLSLPASARATTITSSFDASLTSGWLAGTNFTVAFSYENASLTGIGQEYLSLLSFNFTLLGTQFDREEISQGGQAIFQNGILQYVTAAYFPPPPANAAVSDIAFGFGGPGVIGYIDLNRQFGSGSYALAPTVPEQSSFLSLLVGLATLLLIRLWRPPAA